MKSDLELFQALISALPGPKSCETCARRDASAFTCPLRCEQARCTFPDWIPQGQDESENRRLIRFYEPNEPGGPHPNGKPWVKIDNVWICGWCEPRKDGGKL